jgi:hypothetical protein
MGSTTENFNVNDSASAHSGTAGGFNPSDYWSSPNFPSDLGMPKSDSAGNLLPSCTVEDFGGLPNQGSAERDPNTPTRAEATIEGVPPIVHDGPRTSDSAEISRVEEMDKEPEADEIDKEPELEEIDKLPEDKLPGDKLPPGVEAKPKEPGMARGQQPGSRPPMPFSPYPYGGMQSDPAGSRDQRPKPPKPGNDANDRPYRY